MEAAVSNGEGVALLRQVFDWLKNREMDAFLAVLHPNIDVHPLIGGGDLHGRAAVAEWFREFADAEGALELRPLEFEQLRDCVLVRGYLRYHAGRALAESQVYWVCEVRDGQLVRLESHPSRRSAVAAC